MTTYIVTNNNPIIGKIKENGKQEIKVYDHKSGNMRLLEADKNKVDTFINTRNEKLKKTAKVSTIIGTIVTAGAGIIGAIAGKKVNKSIGALFGASTGFAASAFGYLIADKKIDESITQKFIDENK